MHVTLEREDSSLVLAIEDDGSGFESRGRATRRRKGGFGLVGMQERARLLGGRLDVSSTPSEGTRVVVTVPLPSRMEPAEAALAGKA